MARILIVGGGCRGLRLTRELVSGGHAVRVVTRQPGRQAEIQAAGAECFLGDPDRLVTLRPALEHVAVACWLLATARPRQPDNCGGASTENEKLRGPHRPAAVDELHGSRLAQFMQSLVDTTVRGVVYERGHALQDRVLQEGERIFSDAASRNAIPARVLRADPAESDQWLAQAQAAVRSLLGGGALS